MNSHTSTADEAQLPAAKGIDPTKPKGVDGDVNGKHASTETVPDFQGINAELIGGITMVTDKGGVNYGELISGTLNSNEERKDLPIPVGHATDNAQSGPTKPTAKWTRVPRMDLGLERGNAVEALPTLGKRGSAQIVGEAETENIGKQGVKRGKIQNDSYSSRSEERRVGKEC